MKVFIACAALLAMTLAEPPPSNSYLPPPPGQRNGGANAGYTNGGYSAGASSQPQIVAARNLGGSLGSLGSAPHGVVPNGVNPFARNNPQGQFGPRSQLGADQGYDSNAAPFGRNAFEQLNAEPANYNFEYMVSDFEQGTDFGHHEERQDESAVGQYHVVLPDGRKQTVSYEADERGFKPKISYEESDAAFGRDGGYDANANNRVEQNGGAGYHGNGGSHSNGGNHGNGYNGGRNGY